MDPDDALVEFLHEYEPWPLPYRHLFGRAFLDAFDAKHNGDAITLDQFIWHVSHALEAGWNLE